jgi:hypothetical protein
MRLRTAMVVVGLVAFAAAAAGIGVPASYGAHVSGDEPQYLLTALSLVEDRDLDVSDEIASRAYVSFHEVELDRQTLPEEDGSEISPHDPLLPASLAVPIALGGWVGAKLALATTAGLLAAVLVWIAVVRFGVPEFRAALLIGVFAASAPFAVYGQQVYPELPAALAVAVGIACLTGPLAGRGLAGVGGSVTALPWLSVKYVPVALALAALGLWRLWMRGRPRAVVGLCLVWGIAGAAFALAHLWWYGGLTPYGVGDHFVTSGELGVVGLDPDYAGRSVRLIGLLVDDKFGIAAWQPAWLLALPAVAALVRMRPRGWVVLAAPLAAGWLNATYVALTMQGWWWPGRQVVVVLPCAVLAIVWWAGSSSLRTVVTTSLAALGILSYAWLVVEGLNGDVTWVVDFFETSNPIYRAWQTVLPDYLQVNGLTPRLHALWILVAGVLTWWGLDPRWLRRNRRQAAISHQTSAHPAPPG